MSASVSHEIAEARRDLRASVLEDHVRRVVSEWPPLTGEQVEKLSLLLRTPAGGAAA